MSSDSLVLARARIVELRAALEADEKAPVRLIETHISWVLVGAARAYKLKKPVRLPFLDFTELESRRHFCAEELRLNRRLAPDLYLDVVEVRQGPSGPRFGGVEGELVDVAVRMRRLPDGALWSERVAAKTLLATHVDALASRLAGFHAGADVATASSRHGSMAVHERVAARLIAAVDAWQAVAVRPDPGWPGVRGWLGEELHRLEPFWSARREQGRIRECHGDLHLANIVQIGEESTAFDAVEFDAELRWIDVLDDLAFAVMDLLAHGLRGFAFRLLDGWLERSGDHAGLPGLRYFLVCRALVRASVAVLAQAQGVAATTSGAAGDYLRLAGELASARDPRLAITHGLPGAGKTVASGRLLEAAGAIRIRSDVERKRLFGLSALQSSGEGASAGIYGPAATRATYAALRAAARTALESGWPAIVDAAFLRRSERAAFAGLAASLGAPFTIVDCRAGVPLLYQRVADRRSRADDASEADTAVLGRLLEIAEPLDAGEQAAALVVEAERPPPPQDLAARWLAAR